MKHLLLICALIFGISACSSSKKDEKDVDELTKSYAPILDQDAQVARITDMIQSDQHLNNERKNDLINLVNEQAKKTTEIRQEQSQLRAVLIDELLKSSGGETSETLAAAKKLEDLNKKNIKGLNDFIIKFRSLSGEKDLTKNQLMRDVGNIHLI